ncbi:acetyl-CoA carboxylase carboxyltransferase subunit alpha [Christensenella hongkongensis]|uniref:acetyl-CoA carboxylase carboxyltransferase subunit alpha n=1 Tax=Christensenella hongkongensis TaxID=270498 RepID=UPI0026710DCC|nr:acetyl-CoA carboxylase carboxyltransferase subunit alpha [Christensenella hongkongensis]
MSEKRSAWEIVQTARDPKRTTAQYMIKYIFDDFMEMHGDKLFADDAAVIGGIGYLDGIPVTVVGQEKGADLREKVTRNFGCANPEGYRKSLRLMRQAEKFHRPVICIVDTQGAFCGIGAEERGMGEALARNLLELSRLKTPVIGLFIGEGGSGGAIALAVADKLAMLENAVYSILSPEGFSSILWKDSSRAAEAAELMRMTAAEVKELGFIDDVIPEPEGGAQTDDKGKFARIVKKYLADAVRELQKEPIDKLLEKRYEKIRSFGQDAVKE